MHVVVSREIGCINACGHVFQVTHVLQSNFHRHSRPYRSLCHFGAKTWSGQLFFLVSHLSRALPSRPVFEYKVYVFYLLLRLAVLAEVHGIVAFYCRFSSHVNILVYIYERVERIDIRRLVYGIHSVFVCTASVSFQGHKSGDASSPSVSRHLIISAHGSKFPGLVSHHAQQVLGKHRCVIAFHHERLVVVGLCFCKYFRRLHSFLCKQPCGLLPFFRKSIAVRRISFRQHGGHHRTSHLIVCSGHFCLKPIHGRLQRVGRNLVVAFHCHHLRLHHLPVGLFLPCLIHYLAEQLQLGFRQVFIPRFSHLFPQGGVCLLSPCRHGAYGKGQYKRNEKCLHNHNY